LSEKKERKSRRVLFSVNNMNCVTCGLAIEKKLRKVDGIEGVGSAIMLNKIFVDYDESKLSVTEIMKAIKEAGYENYVTSDVNQMR
jgi:P-type Cu+ transporter